MRTLARLDVDECLDLLAGRYLGRLAWVRDGRPEVRPLNYVLHEGQVIVRLSVGRTLDELADGTPAVFEVDDVELDYHRGWSVIVRGTTEEIWEPAELDRVRTLPLQPWAPGDRVHYLRILPVSITGRRIT
jgi:uncharacterized protein